MTRRESDSVVILAVTLIATALAVGVIGIKTSQLSPAPQQETKAKIKYPRFTTITERAGNAKTVAFLDLAYANHMTFDAIELDDNGDIIRLAVHICYFVSDRDLEAIAMLPHLEELWFLTKGITGNGIQHLEATTTLRKLSIHPFQNVAIPHRALEVLKTKNPNLVIEL